MESKASQVWGQFRQLSEAEQKAVLEKIFEESKNQAQLMDVVANKIYKPSNRSTSN